MYMKTTKQTKNANVENVIDNAIMRVANVARELNINEKRARSFLRRNENVALYDDFRNKTFTRDSNAYKTCVELLTRYKNSLRVAS